MALQSLAAARTVCNLADWRLCNMEVQKILYLAHMVLVGRTDGTRLLVNEPFEAWDYGPVLPSVYHKIKMFGSGSVHDILHAYPLVKDGDEADVLAEAVHKLKGKSASSLVANTHWNGGAWHQNYYPGSRGVPIPTEDILKEYRARVSR